jgi:hypothetical protein
MQVAIRPLVPSAVLPVQAPASTRPRVPPGYGVQEQCLPFTAAAASGLLVRAPLSFGVCPPGEVPQNGRPFTAPFPTHVLDGLVFYVTDDPACRFEGNAFRAEPIPFRNEHGETLVHRAVHPGISFFDRPDQADMFKLHLPYTLQTPARIDSLFLPPLNRPAPFVVLSGLVETDWYAHPVNLVLRCPRTAAVHVRAGDVVCQVVFVHREARDVTVRVDEPATVEGRAGQAELLRWYARRARDRSAYKRMARSEHGRLG